MSKKKKDVEKNSIDLLVEKIISIVESIIQKANYDTTFEATIIKKEKINKQLLDGKYLYTIRYNGQKYEIKSGIGEVKTTDKVWVKIPSGNMQKMHICGIRE